MNRICKVILAAAAVAAFAAPAMAVPTDKLIVRNEGNTADAFTVRNDGKITASGGLLWSPTGLLGIGTGGVEPATQITIVDETAAATRGFNSYQMTDDTQAGVIVFRKSRGTFANPAAKAAAMNDYVGTFHGCGHDGTNWVTTASLAYFIDGPVTTGNVPMAMLFMTGTGAAVQKVERLRVASNGSVIIANKGGKTGTTPLAVSATDGHLYIPTVAGTVTSCATMTTYGGHAPVWVDTTGNKICTCNGTALKCATLL